MGGRAPGAGVRRPGNGLKKRSEQPDARVSGRGQQVGSRRRRHPNGLLRRLYDHGRKVASGEVTDPRFLFLWWEADDRLDLDVRADLMGRSPGQPGRRLVPLDDNPSTGSATRRSPATSSTLPPEPLGQPAECLISLTPDGAAPEDHDPAVARDAGLARVRRLEVTRLDGPPGLHRRRPPVRHPGLGARPARPRMDGPAGRGRCRGRRRVRQVRRPAPGVRPAALGARGRGLGACDRLVSVSERMAPTSAGSTTRSWTAS